jgi:ABC-type transport system involved in multi-copper enzyme maturation permease subunit
MNIFLSLLAVNLKWVLRDKVLYSLLGVGLLFVFLIPLFSLFSPRQVQELSITLSLSAISFVLLVFTVVFGSSSIWRDVERRYTYSVLGLPISRFTYIAAKFSGMSLVLVGCSLILAVVSAIAIAIPSSQYHEQIPIAVHWLNIVSAIAGETLKYVLLSAFALLFSSLSTSFFLPFFSSIALYLVGSASQGVYEFVTSDSGKSFPLVGRLVAKALYYILPNFSAFDFNVYAIYGLPLPYAGLTYTFLYFLTYTAILLVCSLWIFSKRELQ